MTDNSLDACLRLLADRRRRQVIDHLRHEATGTTTFDDLVDRMHSRGSDAGNDPVPDRRDLAIQLQHTHLPKLADHGLVEFEHRSGVVRYRPNERVERVLDSLPGDASLRSPEADTPPGRVLIRPIDDPVLPGPLGVVSDR